jgi:osmotically inducible protein OsmC
MAVTSEATTLWFGDLMSGSGTTSLDSSDAAEFPVTWNARAEGEAGRTNPEELLGAAHAGCFTMALSLILGEAGLTATQMDTSARVTLEQVEGGFAITAVHLTLRAKIPGADQAKFTELANKAKAGCPVSKVLKADITLDASLVS